MTNESPAAFLAQCILDSPYFADEPSTLAELDAYADELSDEPEPLRDRLIFMLDLDIRDLAHNSNYDDFLPDDAARELSDDDCADIDALLRADSDLYERIADALIARALDS